MQDQEPCWCRNSGLWLLNRLARTNKALILYPGLKNGEQIRDRIKYMVFHRRQGHASEPNLRKLAKHLGVTLIGKLEECDACRRGKMRRSPFRGGVHWYRHALGECWHLDCQSPFRKSTREGYKYALTCVEDHTGYVVLMLIKKRSDQWQCLRTLLTWSKTQTGSGIKVLRMDGEWDKPQAVNALQQEWGFEKELTHTYTPQENGLAEVTGSILMTRARVLSCAAGFSDANANWWAGDTPGAETHTYL